MRNTVLAVFVVLVLLSMAISCSSGRKAQKLDRETALAILKDSPSYLSPDGTVNIASVVMIPMKPPNPDWPAEAKRELAFYQKLQEVGWIKEEPQCVLPGIGAGLDPVFHCYAPAGADAVSVNVAGRGTSQEMNLHLITFRNSFGSVTGIEQEGTTAMAEVEEIASPTPVFQRFAPLIPSLPVCNCGYWPKTDPIKTIRRFRFARYDDGWRLAND